MTYLQLQHVTQRFDNGSEGLSEVTVDIEQGSMVFLTGHSGAGKSTMLKLLIGALVPTSGRVVVGWQRYQPTEVNVHCRGIGGS